MLETAHALAARGMGNGARGVPRLLLLETTLAGYGAFTVC